MDERDPGADTAMFRAYVERADQEEVAPQAPTTNWTMWAAIAAVAVVVIVLLALVLA